MRLQTLQDKLRELQQEGTAQPAAAAAVAEPSSVAEAEGGQEAESDDDDLGAPSIDSGGESDSDAVCPDTWLPTECHYAIHAPRPISRCGGDPPCKWHNTMSGHRDCNLA